MRPLDPRLLRYAAAVRPYLVATVVLGVVLFALTLLQLGFSRRKAGA